MTVSRRPSVLLLDDDERVLNTRGRLFVALGMDPVSVASAEEALAAIEEREFDLAIVDVNLSGDPGDQSGLDVVRLLTDRMPSLPVAVYSGYYDIESLPEMEDLSITSWIVKGSSLASLESQLSSLVAAAEAHRDRRAQVERPGE